MELQDFLKWLMSPAGAVVAYWLMENVSWLVNLAPEAKRYVSWVLAGGVALLGWELMVILGYAPLPDTIIGRWEAAFAVVAATILAQIGHARLQLSKKKRVCCK